MSEVRHDLRGRRKHRPCWPCDLIIREDLLGHAHAHTPTMMDYKICADNDSMYNTPATYSWYLAGLVFKWLKAQGGLKAMAKINLKAKNCTTISTTAVLRQPVAKTAAPS